MSWCGSHEVKYFLFLTVRYGRDHQILIKSINTNQISYSNHSKHDRNRFNMCDLQILSHKYHQIFILSLWISHIVTIVGLFLYPSFKGSSPSRAGPTAPQVSNSSARQRHLQNFFEVQHVVPVDPQEMGAIVNPAVVD